MNYFVLASQEVLEYVTEVTADTIYKKPSNSSDSW